MNKKVTSPQAANKASKILRDKSTSAKSKTSAGSSLSQTKATQKVTGDEAASAASNTLTDKRMSKASKSAAGSALSQKPSKKKK